MNTTAMQANNRSQVWVHGMLILAVMLIATSFPLGKIIADEMPAGVMMQIRFVMAALIFAPLILFRHGIQIPSAKTLVRYALLSLPLVTFFWCMFEALKYTSALKTGALFTTVPAMTALFAFLINGEKTSLAKSLGLLIGTLGAVWIIFKGKLAALIGLELNVGDLLFFCGTLAFSLYNVFVKRTYSGEPSEVMTFWVILFGAVWLSIATASDLYAIEWRGVSYQVLAALFYLALFTTLITFFLFQLGTVKIGPTKVAAYGFLNPIFVYGFSMLLGMASFSISILPGLAFVIAAMFVIQRGD